MNSSLYPDYDYVFGQMMLTLRNKIGLTQTGLGDALGVSRRTIGSWESGRKYPNVDNLMLFIELAMEQAVFPAGHEEAEIRLLWKLARQKVFIDEQWLHDLLLLPQSTPVVTPPRSQSTLSSIKPQPLHPVNLPFQPTSFVGRTDELTEIARILDDSACRLLTLTGPGGIGKTRLAVETATSQLDNFSDGVVFVSLAPINASNQIVTAICESLHLSFGGKADILEQLVRYLKQRELLLILDNFEHVLDGADIVYDIIRQTQNLTVLVTSRVSLDLQVEWLYNVEGLRYPDLDTVDNFTSGDDLRHYTALQLFSQRALQIQPGFTLSDSTIPTIVRLCQSVAGMPLGIELAATGLRTHSIDVIVQQIRSSIASLSTTLRDIPSRHRSMRAVFDHSWDLLTRTERVLFCRLSVFRGGCTLEACEQIIGATRADLQTLIDQSLLRQMNDGVSVQERLYLLEPIREYALEKLYELYDPESLNRAHADYYLSVAESAAMQWDTPTVASAIEVLNQEHDNLRTVLGWVLDNGDTVIGLRLGGALWRFWRGNGNINEGREWLEALLKQTGDTTDNAVNEARLVALNGAAWLASDQQDFDYAVALFDQSLALRRALGKMGDETHLLLNAARQARVSGHYAQARALLEDAMERLQKADDRGSSGGAGLGLSIYELALVLREQGEYDQSAELYETCVKFHRDIGDQEGMHSALLGLGDIARDKGDIAEIIKYSQPCLEFYNDLGVQWAIGFAQHNLAFAHYLDGDLPQATNFIIDSVTLFRNLKDSGGLAEVLVTYAHILRHQGNLDGAFDALIEAMSLAWAVGPRLMLATTLESLASVLSAKGQTEEALQCLSLADTLRSEMGAPIRPADHAIVERTLVTCRERLGDVTFTMLWQDAQAVLLDDFVHRIIGDVPSEEPQLPEFLPERDPPTLSSQPNAQRTTTTRLDWNNAISVPHFYGRELEINLLHTWILEEHCRVVTLLGLGGIGKSSLAVTVMHQLADHFDVVIWRSLRDVSECDFLLIDLLQIFASDTLRGSFTTTEARLNMLLEQLRSYRVLLVLDNVETTLEYGEQAGQIQPAYEGFGRFLQKVAEINHRSCVMLTSREKPAVLIPHEGRQATVRTLRLSPLDTKACDRLLMNRGIRGTSDERNQLIEAYTGNPLALKIVAQTIVDLFDGELALFLKQGEVIFGGIRDLLRAQFERLSELEDTVVIWLAILREPATLDDLQSVFVAPISRSSLLETIDSLQRRSLLERGQHAGSFTLQSVLLEYITTRLIAVMTDEILNGKLNYLLKYSLELAQTPEYLRQLKLQQIITPILHQLQRTKSQSSMLEQHLVNILHELATRNISVQGYGPANILIFLHLLRGHLRELDLSHLMIRGASLQGINLQDSSFAHTTFVSTVFTGNFDAITAVAVDRLGQHRAAACTRGEIHLWTADGITLKRVWKAHGDMIWSLEFSPDGKTLASGSWDGLIKLWDVNSGELLCAGQHGSYINDIAFSPDGRLIATSGTDAQVKLWDVKHEMVIQTLKQPSPIPAVIWSPDGNLLVTGDLDGVIRIFAFDDDHCEQILAITSHDNWIDGLAIAPDGKTLASASWDRTVKLWHISDGQLMQTLTGHTDQANCVCWSPDGRTLASSSRDQTIWLWDVEQQNYRAMLQGHTNSIKSLAFLPNSNSLLSGSVDGSLRLWDVRTTRCISVNRGFANIPMDIDWSPDSRQLASGNIDATVTVYDVTDGGVSRLLQGHISVVMGISWNHQRSWLASSEWNNLIVIWDVNIGKRVLTLQHPDGDSIYLHGITWSPDGTQLACATNRHGILAFDVNANSYQWEIGEFPTWIRPVAWSPDNRYLAGGGDDGIVYIWNPENGDLLRELTGHNSMVNSIVWSTDCTRLASAGVNKLMIWDTQDWSLVQSIDRVTDGVLAIAWSKNNEHLISGDSNGSLHWWDIQTGNLIQSHIVHTGAVQSLKRSPDDKLLASCGDDGLIVISDLSGGVTRQMMRRDRPYERLNITGVHGLTDAQKATLRSLGAIDQ